jgi:hypothetical protein
MPSNPQSLRLTDLYRQRLLQSRQRVEREAAARWPTIEALDGTDWPQQLAQVVGQAQGEAVRATGGYLSAFLRLETGAPAAVTLDSRTYAGLSRDGRPLQEALRSPLIGTLGKLKEGATPDEALSYGLNRATRMVSVDFDHAHRSALLDTLEADDRFAGFERATAGTCGACMALSADGGPHFDVHPGCQCVPQPVVSGVPDLFSLPSPLALFASKTKAEQDEALGAEAADKVRSGAIELSDLVAVSPLATQPDFLTQAPIQDAE